MGREARRWPTWPVLGRVSSRGKGPRPRAGGPGARRRGRLGCRGPRAVPLSRLLPRPSPPPSSTSKRTHERGFPGRRSPAAAGRAGAAAFIAVRQTGRNSHFPPGCSPARRPAGRPGAHFNPLRASGARPGRPSCLPPAAAASGEAAGPGPPRGTVVGDRVWVSRQSGRWPRVTGELVGRVGEQN